MYLFPIVLNMPPLYWCWKNSHFKQNKQQLKWLLPNSIHLLHYKVLWETGFVKQQSHDAKPSDPWMMPSASPSTLSWPTWSIKDLMPDCDSLTVSLHLIWSFQLGWPPNWMKKSHSAHICNFLDFLTRWPQAIRLPPHYHWSLVYHRGVCWAQCSTPLSPGTVYLHMLTNTIINLSDDTTVIGPISDNNESP